MLVILQTLALVDLISDLVIEVSFYVFKNLFPD